MKSLDGWYKATEKDLLVAISLNNIETNKRNKKKICILLIILILNFILTLTQILLLIIV